MPVLSKPEAQLSLHERGGTNKHLYMERLWACLFAIALCAQEMTTKTIASYGVRFSLVLRGCPDNAGIMKALIKTFATDVQLHDQ